MGPLHHDNSSAGAFDWVSLLFVVGVLLVLAGVAAGLWVLTRRMGRSG